MKWPKRPPYKILDKPIMCVNHPDRIAVVQTDEYVCMECAKNKGRKRYSKDAKTNTR
mgnify:CR=1 FL=1